MSLPGSRAEARTAGTKTYYTGRPCPSGHLSPKRTSTGRCVECDRDRWRLSEPNRTRQANLRRLREYGLTPEQYAAMLMASEGLCRVCAKQMEMTGKISSSRAVVDHCHTSGTVRGIVCNGCNRGMGYFGDDPTALRAAADYLESHASS